MVHRVRSMTSLVTELFVILLRILGRCNQNEDMEIDGVGTNEGGLQDIHESHPGSAHNRKSFSTVYDYHGRLTVMFSFIVLRWTTKEACKE